ncbi:MAG: chromophore lyase CpcT/CpeT [Ignavibacteriales bacterium]|nr:chromophore lyase CpcT/CpeT [Ignavibacteriales bacterium]
MKTGRKVILIVTFLLLCGKLSSQSNDLKLLADWMTGSFSSYEQSQKDTNFYDIRLKMMRIWKLRDGAIWLYIEQAMSTNLEKPYRQRIYRLSQIDDTTFESKVYEIKDPLRFSQSWLNRNEEFLATLTPDSLIDRQGCAIILKRVDENTFSGSTIGKECLSSLRGAEYAISEVIITSEYITTWDRGYNSANEQVWGAEIGGYIFKKVKDYPVE